MNKPVYLGLSILDLSKTVMYELWHDYVNRRNVGNAKLLYGYKHCTCKSK